MSRFKSLNLRPHEIIRDFLFAAESPFNLAFFRMIFFGMIFFDSDTSWAVFWSTLPAELRFPPPGVGPVLRYLPINANVAMAASIVFIMFSFTAMVGLKARFSATVVTILGVYLGGLGNLYGKINHNHHMIWFAAILAASPCADVLAVDALFAARRRALAGFTAPPAPHAAYALPLRLIWLLFGLIYFAPGFWKLKSAGFAWALSENPKIMLYNKWAELGGWTPLFRVDLHPWLYRLGALGTIAFEVSFIFLILHPVLRPFAILWGVLFHMNVYFLMDISFFSLLRCYIVFFDWERIGRWVGRRVRPVPITVAFDGGCAFCRSVVACVRVLGPLSRIEWVDRVGGQALADVQREGFVAVDSDGSPKTGLAGARAVARRVVALWPLLPLLRWPALGRIVAARHARSVKRGAPARPATFRETPRVAATATVGAILLGAVALASATNFNSWPVSRYPTFAGLSKPEISVLRVLVLKRNGEEVELSPHSQKSRISTSRINGLLRNLLAVDDPADRARRLAAFWKVISADNGITDARRVTFFRDVLDTTPGAAQPLKKHELLCTIEPS